MIKDFFKQNATAIVAGFLIAAAAVAWWVSLPDKASVNQWRPATPAPQLKAAPKTTISPPKVAVFVPSAKRKLDLPPEVQADPKQHVIDATLVASDEHPQTVAVVINDQTGEVQTFVRKEELPWLAAEQRGEIRLDYGVRNMLARVGRVTFRDDLVRVKAFHLGVNASADTDGQYFAGAGIGYRW